MPSLWMAQSSKEIESLLRCLTLQSMFSFHKIFLFLIFLVNVEIAEVVAVIHTEETTEVMVVEETTEVMTVDVTENEMTEEEAAEEDSGILSILHGSCDGDSNNE